MLNLAPGRIILEPTTNHFESQAVLNPGCIKVGDTTHLFYRAVAPGNYSSIGYCQIRDGQIVYRHPEPLIAPRFAYERHGIEDPRIVYCAGTYYLFYVVYDGTNAQIAYSTMTELPYGPGIPNFHRHRIISAKLSYGEIAELCAPVESTYPYGYFCTHYLQVSPQWGTKLLWEKDAFIFPEKINGKFALVHRILPEIQVIYFDDFSQLTTEFWLENLSSLDRSTLLTPKYPFESRYIGGGCPPIRTKHGWLFIYHAVALEHGTPTYRAAAALLDLHDPTRVLGRLPYPLFEPTETWEHLGDVGNVVFPTGAVLEGEMLHIYYGAADSRIAVRSVSLNELLAALLPHPPKHSRHVHHTTHTARTIPRRAPQAVGA